MPWSRWLSSKYCGEKGVYIRATCTIVFRILDLVLTSFFIDAFKNCSKNPFFFAAIIRLTESYFASILQGKL